MSIRTQPRPITRRIQNGFTIVELLIVIVIIGILAAIVIVAYNGIQQRAQDAQNTALAKAYGEALQIYLTTNGSYPASTNGGWFCLGNGSRDINSDGLFDCDVVNGTTVGITRDAAFNTAIAPYVNTDAQVANFDVHGSNGESFMGPQYWSIDDGYLDGQPHRWFMFYVIHKNETCSYGNVVTDDGWPNFLSTRPAGGYTWEETDGRDCLIALPKPN